MVFEQINHFDILPDGLVATCQSYLERFALTALRMVGIRRSGRTLDPPDEGRKSKLFTRKDMTSMVMRDYVS